MHVNNSDGQINAVVRTAQLIHAAITLGLIAFGVVVAFIMFTGADNSIAQELTPNKENYYGVVGVALQAPFVHWRCR